MLEIIGGIIAIIGALFLFLAGLGLLRMPDVFNRMQAGTKATTLGSLLIFVGIALSEPGWSWKLAGLVIFIFLTNPLSSHALARATHFFGNSTLLKDEQKKHVAPCEECPPRDDLQKRRDEQ
jgi:multicomponent Na+:H+ antiporter subunit G